MLNAYIDDTIAAMGGMNPAIEARIKRLQNAQFLETVKGGNGMFYEDSDGIYHMLTRDAVRQDEESFRG